MTSYKPEVDTTGDGRWNGSALRFATEAEALAYAQDLYTRWVLVKATRAVPSPDRPTHKFKARTLEAINHA